MNLLLKIYKNYKAWIITHFPAFIMLIYLAIDTNWRKIFFKYSAYIAVVFLIISLALNPLKSLFPTSFFLKELNKYRREFGVTVFSYTLIHILCYIIKKGGLKAALPYIFTKTALIPAVYIALPILLIMTLSSNDISVKKLGYSKWKNIHKNIYLAEIAIFIHMILVEEAFYAFLLFTPLFILQITKIIKAKKLKY
jgi:sulfoxide reductase heme-binding subunit YedZ